jgi:hypothetical protein
VAGCPQLTGQVRQGKLREGKSSPAVLRFLEHDLHGRKPPALSPWIGPHRCQPNLQRSVLSMRSPPCEPSFGPATSKLGAPLVGDKTGTTPRRVPAGAITSGTPSCRDCATSSGSTPSGFGKREGSRQQSLRPRSMSGPRFFFGPDAFGSLAQMGRVSLTPGIGAATPLTGYLPVRS